MATYTLGGPDIAFTAAGDLYRNAGAVMVVV